nr:hypothetical protein [Tanacetum cinerariifolium]
LDLNNLSLNDLRGSIKLHTNGKAMINSIQYDLKFWTAKEKKTQKIDRLVRSLLIQGLPNDIYSLIDCNETAKDLWDALERQIRGSEYGEQDRKAAILYEYETFKATKGESQTKNLMDINIDALYNILKQNQGDVNDALGYKKKVVVITSDPLALVAEKLKMLLAKKDSDEQVLLAEDQAGMESSSDFDQEINANMVFMAQIEKFLSDSKESSSSAEETIVEKGIEKANQQTKDLKNQNKDLQKKYDVLINQVNTFKEQNNEFNEQIKVLNEKNVDLLAQTEVLQDQLKVKHVVIDTHTECQAQYTKPEEERYEYMIRYSALCDNDKQHRKKTDEQEILFDKTSCQLVEMNNNVLSLQEKILEKETKILELEGCVSNKDVEIKKCLERLNECENKVYKIRQTNQTYHMIMPSKDTLYNGRKGIGFENPSYFEKAKDLRPSLYDEKVIGLG